MLEILLLRHAKAETARAGLEDRARVLTDRGRRDAAAAGKALARQGVVVDVVLASPSARTRETALIAAAESGFPPPRFIETLYHAEPEAIWAAALASGADRVAIIGHNPGLHECAAALVRQAHDRSKPALELLDGLPTAAFAHFGISGDVLEAAGPRLITAWRL